ncbi:MAG: hypothetical protein R3C14_42230 [Caldilineaceae bacterium]
MPHKKEAAYQKQLRKGDPTAWAQLVDQWSPRIYSYVSYNTTDDREAEALMQFILSEVVQTLLSTPRLDNLTTLLFTIAYKHVLLYRQQLSDYMLPRLLQPPHTLPAKNAREQKFTQALRQISLETQQLLLLRYLCDVPMPELSHIAGKSEDVLAHMLCRNELFSPLL